MSRIIQARVRTSAVQATNLLASLLSLELLKPSKQLYLSVSSLRDTPILPNDLGQFGSLFPEVAQSFLSLNEAMALLVARGVDIRLICSSKDALSELFLSQLPPTVNYRTTDSLYQLGLYGEHFCLRGGLQLTDFGVGVANDSLELITAPAEVNQQLLEVAQYWEDLA